MRGGLGALGGSTGKTRCGGGGAGTWPRCGEAGCAAYAWAFGVDGRRGSLAGLCTGARASSDAFVYGDVGHSPIAPCVVAGGGCERRGGLRVGRGATGSALVRREISLRTNGDARGLGSRMYSACCINAGRGELAPLPGARGGRGGDMGLIASPADSLAACDGMGGYADSLPKPEGRSGRNDMHGRRSR